MQSLTQLRKLGLFDARVPRYTSYPTAPQFKPGVGNDIVSDWISNIPEGSSVSLYVHVPFCRRLCWFCACRTQGTQTAEPVGSYVETLKMELALIKARLPMGRQARARSNRWADREAVLERYGSKTTFANWAEGVLEHYLEDGLTVTADGVRLSCDPFWEAANFEAQSHGLLPAVKTLGNKVHVLRAETGSTTINAAGMTARGAQITPIEGGHLIAMENPQAVSDWMRSVADLERI